MHYIIALIITLIVLLSPSPGIAADATGFTVQNIHNFDRATENPWASLIPAPDGNLYGTSNGGGTKPLKPPKTPGAVYKTNPSACSIDPSSPDCFKVVHTFSQPDAQGRNSDGYGPRAPLSLGPDGFLYGTTFWGGQGGTGVLFRIDPATAMFTTLFSFGTPDGPPSGANPMGGPVSDGHGNFYGAAKNYGAGVIYKWSGSRPATTVYAFRVTHDAIRYPDGAAPYGSPVFGADGKLYGMTFFGGKNNAGTVYSLDPVSKTLKVIYDFAGYTPSDCPEDVAGVQSLFLASDGKLYGTSLFGGANGTGFAFRVDPAANGIRILHEFGPCSRRTGDANADGANPKSTLTEGDDGVLYGTTYRGGASGYGTIFRIAKDGSSFQSLHSFGSETGLWPAAGLVRLQDGSMIGTTFLGGVNGGGVIYRLWQTHLTVRKILMHPDHNHLRLFNLQIDGVTVRANVNAGSTSPQLVDPGRHRVGETGGTGTSLLLFGSEFGGDCAADGSIVLAAGGNKTCTITNYDHAGGCAQGSFCCEPGDGRQGCQICSRSNNCP